MEKPLNVYQRIIAIMDEIDYIQKGPGMVNNQYRFVSHDAVMAKLHPLLVKHRLVVISSVKNMIQEGNRTRVDLIVTFANADDKTDNFQVEYSGYGVDNSDKGPGKAISYALKYALLKTFALETGDDPDNDQSSSYEPPKCLDFEGKLPVLSTAERKKVDKFLEHSAKLVGKHVEEVKREALTRMDEFMRAVNNWDKK